MGKTKSKLQIAKEEVDALVKLTNSKIMELGIYTRSLHNALTMIQVQFDKIRNVPSKKQLEYQKIKEVCLTWKQQVEKIEVTMRLRQKPMSEEALLEVLWVPE